MNWTPTMSLRFVKSYASDGETIIHILQQMWVRDGDGFIDWRAVPLTDYYV